MAISVRFQIGGHTAAQWSAGNPVLLARELGIETDTKRQKLGDGATAWNSLPYIGAAWADISSKPANLVAIASLSTSANKLNYWNGVGTAGLTDLTAFGRSLIDDADAPAARITLGLVIGTDVQAFDSDVAALAANSVNGLWTRTGTGTGAARTINGTANQITFTNGDGVSGNPTASLPSTVVAGNVTYAGSTAYFATQGDATQRIRVGHYDSSSVSFPTGLVAAQILAGATMLDIATRDNAAAVINFRVGSGVAIKATLSGTALNLASGVAYQINALQVVGARKTGWTTATGTADRATFATYTAPAISSPPTQAEVQALADHVQVLSRHLKALIDDLHATAGHGLIGP